MHILNTLKPRSLGYYKEKAKLLAGALGHAPGWAQKPRAWHQAVGSKRVDRVSPTVVSTIRSAGFNSLDGCRIMEFGTGHLLSECLVCWIGGAREVVAVDYFPIVDLRAARWALTSSDRNVLINSLSEIQDHTAADRRIADLRCIRPWTPAALAKMGIHYQAPVDAAQALASLGKFDLIMSTSVLEHVPASHAAAILQHLHEILTEGGVQYHHIHLEDHRDLRRAPFAFLGADDDFLATQCDARGNRLRASDWLALAGSVTGGDVTVVGKSVNQDARLPERLDPAFASYDTTDLRTASLALQIRGTP